MGEDQWRVIYISQLKKLGVLDLTRTKITDKSVPYLKGFNDMDELYIMKTRITEAGYKQIYDYYKKANRNWIIYREDDM